MEDRGIVKKTIFWRNKYFYFGIIVFLMLMIGACSSDSNTYSNVGANTDNTNNTDQTLTGLTGITTGVIGIVANYGNITSLTEVAQIPTGDAAMVRCRLNYCYTTGWYHYSNNFNIVDMTNPAAPEIKGRYSVGDGYGLDLYGSKYAYINTDGGGSGIFSSGTVGVMDISDPDNPVPVMQNSAGYYSAYQSYYYKGYLYNASEAILSVYNVTDPDNLVFVKNIATSTIYWMAFSGDYMYGIDKNTLKIWDLSDPANPVQTGSAYNSYLDSTGIAVKGDYAFAMGNHSDVLVYDVSDKANPSFVTRLILTSGASNQYLNESRILGHYLLIAGAYNFFVVDITKPEAPVEVTSFALSTSDGWTFDVLYDRYAIVSDDTYYHVLKLW
jgi:hypothetical protein